VIIFQQGKYCLINSFKKECISNSKNHFKYGGEMCNKKKNQKRIILTVLILNLLIINVYASWLHDVPVRIKQPDNTIVDVFRSGDEFHNWVHDENEYTIIRDISTDYWCWAVISSEGNLVSTGIPIHQQTAQSIGILPKINISQEKYLEKREIFERDSRFSDNDTPIYGCCAKYYNLH
jgi:hypothetical protein